MKTSKIGIVAAAILLAVTGIGFGIAQAGGIHTDRPIVILHVLSFPEDQFPQEAKSSAADMQLEGPLETGSLSAEYADFDPFSRSADMHLENPIETGSLPESEGIGSIVIFGDDVERKLQEGIVAGGP